MTEPNCEVNEEVVPSYIPPIEPWPEGWEIPDPGPCSGDCLTAADVGVPEYGSLIAYPHPDCPLHGWGRIEEDEYGSE